MNLETPRFLSLDNVVQLHDRLIRDYGGAAGIRDSSLLESALEMPRATFDGQFLHPSLAAMAGAYLFHLVANHPFIDGNKRVGAAAMLVFLKGNGAELQIGEAEFEALVWKVAASELSKSNLNEILENNISPNPTYSD